MPVGSVVDKGTVEGYPVMVRRGGLPCVLCGYVGVPRGHPDYGASMEILEDELAVHGGVTWADGVHDGDGWQWAWAGDVWWIGFDCGHYDDIEFDVGSRTSIRSNKDAAFVRAEIRALAAQLKARERPKLEENHEEVQTD